MCEVRRWQGWSDAKGTSGALDVARGAVAVNAQMSAVSRPVADVVQTLQRQLTATFVSASTLEHFAQAGATLAVRARVLEADGTALRVRTLWERRLQLEGRRR